MTDFVVDEPSTLDAFLRAHGVTGWQIPILLDHGGIVVMRRRERLTPLSARLPLQRLDFVRIVDPAPEAVQRALQHRATRDAHDVAYVPGASAFDQTMRDVYTHRPRTTLLPTRPTDGLTTFISLLGQRREITHPIRDLMIGSHANPEGLLFLRLDMGAPAHVTYEQLEQAERSRQLVVNMDHLSPRPVADGVESAARLLVRGCRIGRAPPYLRKLKRALGGALRVVAPKHFHVVATNSRPAGGVEYMAYGFTIARATTFRNRAEAVRAFSAAGFRRIDGRAVPADAFARFVPRNIRSTSRRGARATSPITGAPTSTVGEFRVEPRTLFDQPQSIDARTDPGTDAARRRMVAEALAEQHERYRDSHPFPEYVRYGHETMDEFMNSFTWTFRYDHSRQLLHFNARRTEYTVVQPVVDPVNDRLFLNFYPSGSAGSIIENLPETDSRFFESV